MGRTAFKDQNPRRSKDELLDLKWALAMARFEQIEIDLAAAEHDAARLLDVNSLDLGEPRGIGRDVLGDLRRE